jgi:anti-anti-sigma regulatory factor
MPGMDGQQTINIGDTFGRLVSDGTEAVAFRQQRIEPLLAEGAAVTLDFTGVRSANSSFVNALVTGLVEDNGEAILSKVVFKGCNPMLQALVESAIHLGLCKREERLLA